VGHMGAEFILHPLIHTFASKNSPPYVEKKKKFLARLPLKRFGFEIVLMIKLAGVTNGGAILRSSIFL